MKVSREYSNKENTVFHLLRYQERIRSLHLQEGSIGGNPGSSRAYLASPAARVIITWHGRDSSLKEIVFHFDHDCDFCFEIGINIYWKLCATNTIFIHRQLLILYQCQLWYYKEGMFEQSHMHGDQTLLMPISKCCIIWTSSAVKMT